VEICDPLVERLDRRLQSKLEVTELLQLPFLHGQLKPGQQSCPYRVHCTIAGPYNHAQFDTLAQPNHFSAVLPKQLWFGSTRRGWGYRRSYLKRLNLRLEVCLELLVALGAPLDFCLQ
jgi:hypothetical protein